MRTWPLSNLSCALAGHHRGWRRAIHADCVLHERRARVGLCAGIGGLLQRPDAVPIHAGLAAGASSQQDPESRAKPTEGRGVQSGCRAQSCSHASGHLSQQGPREQKPFAALKELQYAHPDRTKLVAERRGPAVIYAYPGTGCTVSQD